MADYKTSADGLATARSYWRIAVDSTCDSEVNAVGREVFPHMYA